MVNNECRISKETIDSHWKEILDIVNAVEARGVHLIMIGDFNRNLGIAPKKEDQPSYGGTLVIEFLESGKYVLLNKSNKMKGGPWTRVNPADEECQFSQVSVPYFYHQDFSLTILFSFPSSVFLGFHRYCAFS